MLTETCRCTWVYIYREREGERERERQKERDRYMYTHIHIRMYLRTYIHAYIHMGIHASMDSCIRRCVRMSRCYMYTYPCITIYIYGCIDTHQHWHTGTYVSTLYVCAQSENQTCECLFAYLSVHRCMSWLPIYGPGRLSLSSRRR